MCLGIISCSSDSDEIIDTNKLTAIKIIDIEKNIYIGDEVQLDISLTPADAKKPTILWLSSNVEVATIDSKTGKLSALKVGETTITATASNLDLSSEVTLKILPKKVETLKLDKNELELCIGADIMHLNYQTEPEDATEGTDIKWSSSDNGIVVVDEHGGLTALSDGIATITVSNGTISDKCVVTVPKSLFGFKWGATIDEVNPTVKLSEDFAYNWAEIYGDKPFTAFKFENNKLKSIWHFYDSSIYFREYENFFKEIESLNPPKTIERETIGDNVIIKQDNLEWVNESYKILIRNGEILMNGKNIPGLIIEYRLNS